MTIKISELGNLISFTGNTIFPVVDTANAYITVKSTGATLLNYISGNLTELSVNGNVNSGTYFLGNGYFLTDITSSYGNANVASYLSTHVGNVNATVVTAGAVYTDDYRFANGTPIPATGINNGYYNGYEVGYVEVPQTYPGAANYVLTIDDSGKHVYSNASSQSNVYIGSFNANLAWTVGTRIMIINNGTGNANLIANAGVTLRLVGNAITNSNSRIISAYGIGTLINLEIDKWMIYGTGIV